jgi:ketosteroid isomerase-like protein
MTDLPAVVLRYQDAHDRRDADGALATFTPDALVTDDGHTYSGHAEIREWLSRASVEFTYTRTLIDVAQVDDNAWLVTNHLEGDFPGGVVDLRYRFVVSGELLSKLDIAP